MRFCAQPGCPVRVPKGYCGTHARLREQGRYNAEMRRLYYSTRWLNLRTQVLTDEPLCRACHGQGRAELATDVDHIVPHRGNEMMFWDRDNLQALCHACHSRKTQAGE